ncbi:MAG: hypothetical protein WBL79_09875 [Bacillota bacterium]|nr:hypothetical protein [Bacillota bacterium]HOK70602.1 hypothetical protein [Bacillota bacterium]HOL50949.1 hypothetical protein [Bacillota bacterium]HOO30981.1 hypothetical protein [Bacillota bacterium]HPQ02557.1 hypothetical protein [Bacillota bacterium]
MSRLLPRLAQIMPWVPMDELPEALASPLVAAGARPGARRSAWPQILVI